MTTVMGRVEVVCVDDEHIPALTEFYRQVWDPGATIESVRASRRSAAATNLAAPGEPPPTWLLLQDGRAIAHVTTIPFLLWSTGTERPAYWMKGLWVLPEFQRSSAGFLVLRAALSALDLPTLALVHEAAAVRLFKALKFSELGPLPNRLRILGAGTLLARADIDTLGLQGSPRFVRPLARLAKSAAPLLGPVVNAAMGLFTTLATGPLGRVEVSMTPDFDPDEADMLWHEVRNEIHAAPARSGNHIRWRYGNTGEYVFVQVRSKSRLAGLGVVKRPREQGDPRLRGIRVSTLSDLLYRSSERRTGLAVLRGAERAARALGADALLCSATAASTQSLLRRRAYLPLPNNLHVLARLSKDTAHVSGNIEEWWLTRGDSAGDEVF